MTEAEVRAWINRIVPHDKDGTIRPTEAAISEVERDYPHKSAVEKWELAQAGTLMEAVQRAGIENEVRRVAGL